MGMRVSPYDPSLLNLTSIRLSLVLAVVIDLFARNVVGWSMKPTLSRELALDALMMAVWRRKPDSEVIVHSDSNNADVSLYHHLVCRLTRLV